MKLLGQCGKSINPNLDKLLG